ncbi:hypothetical protein BJV82DRAFT_237137 [Fennellomyces sp. T-0311]|nr:hypothetical protein BJV82DRAFT_237137 [Fennellomyces sp. T-0311]
MSSTEKETDWSGYTLSDPPIDISWVKGGNDFTWNHVLGANHIDASTVQTVNCPRCCLGNDGTPSDLPGSDQYYLVNSSHVCGLQPAIHSSNCTTFIPLGSPDLGILVDVDGGNSTGTSREMIIPHCGLGSTEFWIMHPVKPEEYQGHMSLADISYPSGVHHQYGSDFSLTFCLLVAVFLLFVMR